MYNYEISQVKEMLVGEDLARTGETSEIEAELQGLRMELDGLKVRKTRMIVQSDQKIKNLQTEIAKADEEVKVVSKVKDDLVKLAMQVANDTTVNGSPVDFRDPGYQRLTLEEKLTKMDEYKQSRIQQHLIHMKQLRSDLMSKEQRLLQLTFQIRELKRTQVRNFGLIF
jgi:hypothetical protein